MSFPNGVDSTSVTNIILKIQITTLEFFKEHVLMFHNIIIIIGHSDYVYNFIQYILTTADDDDV